MHGNTISSSSGGADGGRPADRLRRRTDLAPLARPELGEAVQAILADLVSERKPLDIFVLEGTVITGPAGLTDGHVCRPPDDRVDHRAHQRGLDRGRSGLRNLRGLPTVPPNPSASTGLQFHRRDRGYLARTGCPSSGCRSSTSWLPAHPDWISQVVMAVATGRAGDLALDEYHRVHALHDLHPLGCTRNSFFEYKQSTLEFGQGTRTGCLFYELGCKGPMTHSSCNRIL